MGRWPVHDRQPSVLFRPVTIFAAESIREHLGVPLRPPRATTTSSGQMRPTRGVDDLGGAGVSAHCRQACDAAINCPVFGRI